MSFSSVIFALHKFFRRSISPQLLQIIELAFFFNKDMRNTITIIHQNPTAFSIAFFVSNKNACLRQFIFDIVSNSFNQDIISSAGNNKIISYRRNVLLFSSKISFAFLSQAAAAILCAISLVVKSIFSPPLFLFIFIIFHIGNADFVQRFLNFLA